MTAKLTSNFLLNENYKYMIVNFFFLGNSFGNERAKDLKLLKDQQKNDEKMVKKCKE